MKFHQNWSVCSRKPGEADFSEAFPAQVPGNVQWDYARAKGLENYSYDTNVEAFRQTEDWSWKYSSTLSFDAGADERVFFVAEGIDYIFDILLDGNVIHSQEGMYTRVELDITDQVKPGSELEVLIHPHPKRPGSAEGTRQEADQCCKPPVTYGWDWNPRLVISGMWLPAYIETRKADHIHSCEPFYTLNADRTRAEVCFETDCAGEVTYTLTDPDGNTVYSGTEPHCTVENVRLWWCSGQGEPNLYTWKAVSGSDEKGGRIGFRTVRLVHNEDVDVLTDFPKGRYPCPITIELNGRRVFAKGSNWVNPDVFFGRITDEVYKEQVKLARDANMNIFRIWGGAGINKPAFYEQCDENGIMVWQEFMLACNNYVGTPRYLAVLEQEATAVIKSLRRHPSIVMWCGGHELFNDWSGMDDQSLALRLLNKLCFDLDRDRPFIMASPVYGMGHGGYTFRDLNSGEDVMQKFNACTNTAYTEFGVPSITAVEDLKKIIPENELFPIRDTPAWRIHHGFGAWLGNTWVCPDILDHYFGEDTTLAERIHHSDWLQCAGYKAIFEEARRQWGRCSMAINWCFNEPWITAAGNSLLTHPSKPKPAYYAVKDSLRTAFASARMPRFDWRGGQVFTAELWYLNDGPEAVSDTVRVSVKLGDRVWDLLTWQTGNVDANTNLLGPAVNLKLPLDADTNELWLILEAQSGNSSEYKLLFRSTEKPVFTMTMNV